jgi:hypothetical protein
LVWCRPLILLVLLALASGYAVYFRFRGEEAADERALREWLEESRVFRKTLSELGREYFSATSAEQREKLRQELQDQLYAIAAPLRQFATHLPLFPTVYRLELHLRPFGKNRATTSSPDNFARDPTDNGLTLLSDQRPEQNPDAAQTVIVWESGLPFDAEQVRRLEHVLVEDALGSMRAVVWYQLHAFAHQQLRAMEQERFTWGLLSLILGISLAAVGWVAVYLFRQRRREQEATAARQRLEEARRLALENELRRQRAEQEALQLRSQIFAQLAVLAGCYAHNIKNLLVRPIALLRQCLQQPIEDQLRTALQEVGKRAGHRDRSFAGNSPHRPARSHAKRASPFRSEQPGQRSACAVVGTGPSALEAGIASRTEPGAASGLCRSFADSASGGKSPVQCSRCHLRNAEPLTPACLCRNG